MKRNILFSTLTFGFLLLTSLYGFAQSEQQKLEQRRQEIMAEIQQTNRLLSSNKKQSRSVLQQIEDLDLKIKSQEKLIAVISQQAGLLNRKIRNNRNEISKLNKALDVLKADYADMIVKSYKSKSEQSRLMFLLSSDNFLQAYKRLQYMKQYTQHRRVQGEEIGLKTASLQILNDTLGIQLKAQEVLLAEHKKEQEKIEEQKRIQKILIGDLRKKERTFASQIKKKQTEIARIDKQIQSLVDAAIASANKSSGSAVSAKFNLTPEAKIVADNFLSNKGNLPWPIEKGLVVMGYGKQPHPYVKNVYINSNGVRIATEEGAKARAIFQGVVLEVQIIKGANKTVLVQHGNYISVYNNLSKVFVKKGDKVTIYQEIGEVYTDKTTGETLLKFSIFQDSQVQNPALWIYRM
ncbi:MAG: peptidoglycan DD-metalloendopeptidase family protein [Flavobacteriaceae bacterium]|nr:peptidoglycan DD-metalloendopeptidase family protein [Flavobacteriaceae bacterium]